MRNFLASAEDSKTFEELGKTKEYICYVLIRKNDQENISTIVAPEVIPRRISFESQSSGYIPSSFTSFPSMFAQGTASSYYLNSTSMIAPPQQSAIVKQSN